MKNNKKKKNSIKASRVAASAAGGAVPAGDPSSSGGVGVYFSSGVLPPAGEAARQWAISKSSTQPWADQLQLLTYFGAPEWLALFLPPRSWWI